VAPLTPPRAGFSFPPKQTLIYSVDWRVFPAGTAVLHFEATGDRERITANADTLGAINLLFHVGDRFQSTFDREKGCTYEFRQADGRGAPPDQLHAQAGLRAGQVDSGRKEPGDGQAKHLEQPISGCLTDLLTGIFYASSQPMTLGQSFVLPVVDALAHRGGNHEGGRARRDQDHAGNLQNAARATHRRRRRGEETAAIFGSGNTDDERHLPVQMRARLFWGTITFRLTGNDDK